MAESYIQADWPVPSNVHCLVTTRRGGASEGPFESFNLGMRGEDDAGSINANHGRLRDSLGPQLKVQWLRQVHGTRVYRVEPEQEEELPQADALYTRQADRACGVLTADCLPVCFSSKQGDEVAIAHAGWRGLAAGVLEDTVANFGAAPEDILAWLGPAIGPCHFEVGGEVREFYMEEGMLRQIDLTAGFEPAGAEDKWMADLYTLARLRLNALGLEAVFGGGRCTFCEEELFYSYRRDGDTGRFATLIYRS